MKIRKALLKDLEEIDRIYVEGSIKEAKLQFSKKEAEKTIKNFDEYKKDRLKGFKKNLKDKKYYWIIVEINKKVIGFGEAYLKNKKAGMIENIYVDKKFRKKGIGTKIAKDLINWLKKKKIKDIGSACYIKNIPSLNMHKKLGFKPLVLKMRLER